MLTQETTQLIPLIQLILSRASEKPQKAIRYIYGKSVSLYATDLKTMIILNTKIAREESLYMLFQNELVKVLPSTSPGQYPDPKRAIPDFTDDKKIFKFDSNQKDINGLEYEIFKLNLFLHENYHNGDTDNKCILEPKILRTISNTGIWTATIESNKPIMLENSTGNIQIIMFPLINRSKD